MIRMFRQQLFSAFWEWVEVNKEAIGDKNYRWFLKEGKRAEDNCNNAIKIMATALWMFNMISNFGVLAGIEPNSVNLQNIDTKIDEASTKRLLNLCAASLSLQFLPKEAVAKEFPIISGKHFSLKLYTQNHS